MIIYPAIDLKDGRPVRLTRGDFATTEQVAEDALETARSFEKAGATHLHIVDLDGALAGRPVNDAIIRMIVKNTNLIIQIGGGIRTAETVDYYLNDLGVARVILGSVAIKDPAFAKKMIERHGAKIAIGIDAKDGRASGGGWLEDSDEDFVELALAMSRAGARTIIYTDIARDGTLSGPDLNGLAALKAALEENAGCDPAGSQSAKINHAYCDPAPQGSQSTDCDPADPHHAPQETLTDIIASGGVTDINDIKNLAALEVAGVICGKSIYKGTLSLRAALEYQKT